MYRRDGHELRHPDGRLLLAGPVEEIAAFAAALNGAPPATDKALRAALLDLIEGTSDCSFAPFIPLTEEAAADHAAALQDITRRAAEADARFAQLRLL